LISRFFCRKIVSLPALKVPVVFHHLRNGFLLPSLPPWHRLRESKAEQAAVGGGGVTAAVAVAALQAAGGAQAAQWNQQVAAAATAESDVHQRSTVGSVGAQVRFSLYF